MTDAQVTGPSIEVWRCDLVDGDGFRRPFQHGNAFFDPPAEIEGRKDSLSIDAVCDNEWHTGFDPSCECGVHAVTDVLDLLLMVTAAEYPYERNPWVRIIDRESYFGTRTVISRGILHNAHPIPGTAVLEPVYPRPSLRSLMVCGERERKALDLPIYHIVEGDPPSTWKGERFELTGPVIIGTPIGPDKDRDAIRARLPDDIEVHFLPHRMLRALHRARSEEKWWIPASAPDNATPARVGRSEVR